LVLLNYLFLVNSSCLSMLIGRLKNDDEKKRKKRDKTSRGRSSNTSVIIKAFQFESSPREENWFA